MVSDGKVGNWMAGTLRDPGTSDKKPSEGF